MEGTEKPIEERLIDLAFKFEETAKEHGAPEFPILKEAARGIETYKDGKRRAKETQVEFRVLQ